MSEHDYTAALEAFRDVGRSAMQDCGTDLSAEIAAIEHALVIADSLRLMIGHHNQAHSLGVSSIGPTRSVMGAVNYAINAGNNANILDRVETEERKKKDD